MPQKYTLSSSRGNTISNDGILRECFDTFSSKSGLTQTFINNYNQSCSINFPCCSFTGKEKDSETGYGYFGARYMDHELMTMWLSVDPMADKYPSISPYAYCAWNPVKLVDPDGMDTFNIHLDRGRIYRQEADGDHCIRFIKDGEILDNKTLTGINSPIKYMRGDDWELDDSYGHTDYLEFGDVSLGNCVFNVIKDLESEKEWDFYNKLSGGELSSSGRNNIMVHTPQRYSRSNVQKWRHYHPNNTDRSWFPSESDQMKSRELGVPCFLNYQGEERRFDEVVKKRNLTPSEYGRIFGLCH